MIQYPLKFEPILKEKIWGGEKLNKLLNKSTVNEHIGESWEVSDVNQNISIVANGNLKGKSLKELIALNKHHFLGFKVYEKFGNNFPLLIKFIDAKEALSIQLHPNDKLAKQRHNSFGKTEMWYVMQAEENSNLIVGFKKKVTKKEYLSHLNNKTLTQILNIDLVKEGDVYFIPTGRVHAIGAGVLLAEIQQTSDITYRIYDWDRKDDLGNYRELHTKNALDALDLSSQSNYQTNYLSKNNEINNIVDCPYFTTNIIILDQKYEIDNSGKDSFVIYMCVHGKGVCFKTEEFEEELNYGETLLMPANLKKFSLVPKGPSKLLEVYIQ